MVRRAEDTDDTGALSRGARPTWAVLVLIAAILTAGGAVLAAERAVATVVAQEVVAPVARKLDDHLASSAALRVVKIGRAHV